MLRALAHSSYQLVAVMATPLSTLVTATSVWSVAEAMGFETWPAKLVKEPALAGRLRSRHVDILLNVHSRYIIHKAVLSAPRYGAFNLHPGPLPRYAGLNAVSWAIYRGERMHGVTIHKMDPKIDAGPIVYQTLFPIEESDTALSLSLKCVQQGVPLMLRLLELAAADPGSISLVPQDASRREYFGTEVPEGGHVLWSSSASKVLCLIRACDYFPFQSPWGHPRARLGAQDLAIIKARRTGIPCDTLPGTVGDNMQDGILVACQDEWVLVTKLKVCGNCVRATEILKKGDHFENER